MSIKHGIYISLAFYVPVCVLLYLFANPEIISIAFRLINFAVLIGLAVILYQRILGPKSKELMQQEELKKEAFAIRHDELIQKQHQLKKKFENQDQECRYLLSKIDQWRSHFDERQRAYEIEREQSHKQAHIKARQQADMLSRDRLYKQATNKTVKLMHKELQKRFSDSKQQKIFINDLITFMRKNTS